MGGRHRRLPQFCCPCRDEMVKGNSWAQGCVSLMCSVCVPHEGWGSAMGELCTVRREDVQRGCSLRWPTQQESRGGHADFGCLVFLCGLCVWN